MKVLVAYLSWTGNTKKVAKAICQEAGPDALLKETGEVADLSGYDIIFFGFPIRSFGKPPDEAVKFFKGYCQGRNVALFITHGAPEDSPFIPEWLIACRQVLTGGNIIDIFHCQGEIAQPELDKILRNPDPVWQERGRNLAMAKGQPDAGRLKKARIFAARICADMMSN